ncbi:MAG: hypothetical protein ABSG36_11400 [Acidimicrobiales bacterium]|jgi:hypothetical protein
MADPGSVDILFSLRDLQGVIETSVTANSDPRKLGYVLLSGGSPVDFAEGFPVCRAAVAYPADGYAAVFGWTQMVTSTDSGGVGEYAMDPIAIYSEVSTPFAWYGFKPTLFDAPSRETRIDMVWQAHSFLCVSPDAVLTRRVQAVAGFSWGFDVADGNITISGPAALESASWDEHLALLKSNYPSWAFDPGFRC